MSTQGEVLVASDRAEFASLGAELIGRAITDALKERDVARVALSGGSTPSDTYKNLASLALPFDRIEWYWVDERAVAPGSDRSNFGAAMKDFGLPLEGSRALGALTAKGRFFRMEGEDANLVDAALRYERALRRSFGVASKVAFDAMTLGVGDDGHTASLFPGMHTVSVDDRLVLAVDAQPNKGLEARITLTAPVIQRSRLLLVMARGESKKKVIELARAEGPKDEIPSRLIQKAKGRVVWLVDRAAAP